MVVFYASLPPALRFHITPWPAPPKEAAMKQRVDHDHENRPLKNSKKKRFDAKNRRFSGSLALLTKMERVGGRRAGREVHSQIIFQRPVKSTYARRIL